MRTSQVNPSISFGLLAMLLFAACGGGEGGGSSPIGVANVTPLNGQWINTSDGEDILQFTVPSFEQSMLNSKVDVGASLSKPTPLCNGAILLRGNVDGGKLSLHAQGDATATVCVTGSFTNLRSLRVSNPNNQFARTYNNDRIDVFLSIGLWVSEGSGLVKLKFTEPDSVSNNSTVDVLGCDVSKLGLKTSFAGQMAGFSVAGSKPLAIAELRSENDALLFSDLQFTDGAVIKARDAQGSAITLRRTADKPATICGQ